MVRSAFGHKLRRAFDWARLAIVWLVSIALLIWALGWLVVLVF